VTVRPAAVCDLDAIVAVNRAAATEAYRPIFGDAPYPEEGVRRRYARLLGDPEATMLLAERASEPVGYAAARPGWLEALYVVPAAWGSGVAQALYDAAAAVAGPNATLWVLRDNVRGRRFWERRGWQPTGDEDSSGEVELLYRRMA
jgi:putative acetyltransferase